MSDVIDRPMLEQEAPARSRHKIIDCDIHPSLHARSDLNPFLAKRWQGAGSRSSTAISIRACMLDRTSTRFLLNAGRSI